MKVSVETISLYWFFSNIESYLLLNVAYNSSRSGWKWLNFAFLFLRMNSFCRQTFCCYSLLDRMDKTKLVIPLWCWNDSNRFRMTGRLYTFLAGQLFLHQTHSEKQRQRKVLLRPLFSLVLSSAFLKLLKNACSSDSNEIWQYFSDNWLPVPLKAVQYSGFP